MTRRRWLVAAGAALLPLAAAAYTEAEELEYTRAWQQCQQQREELRHRQQAFVPAEVALAHVGGRPDGAAFHAYIGCKDALNGEPKRSSAVSTQSAARERLEREHERDWTRWRGGLPGLGPYTWVFFANLLLGIALGAWTYRPAKPNPPPPGGLIPPSPPDRSTPAGRRVVGGLIGAFGGFVAFGLGFIAALFFMFLNPVSPLELFLFTGVLTAVFAVGRPSLMGVGVWP
jgi:hypothetical protein